MKRIINLIVFLLLIFASCEKSEVSPPQASDSLSKYQPVRYRVVIDNTEFGSMSGFVLNTATSFPDENKTTVLKEHFNKDFGNFSDTILYQQQSEFNDSAYIGCTYFVEFNALYSDSNNTKKDCNGFYYWKLSLDTIKSLSDTLITINFPRDTIKGKQYDWVSERPIEEICP